MKHAEAVARVAQLTRAADQDPILAAYTGDHGGVPAWDKVQVGGFPAALELGLDLWLAEVEAIALDPAPPSFENTVVALEDVGRHQGRAQTLFGVFTGNLSTPEVQALDREWSPKITAARDRILFDTRLFARLDSVHRQRHQLGLRPDQVRLVERRHDDFVLAGAALGSADQERLGLINQELSRLFSDFSSKVLAEEDTGTALERESDLAGLPEGLIRNYAAAAGERKLNGKWYVVNARSSVDPFLTASARRDLRERVWKLFKNRGDNGGPNDTNATLSHIVKLRAERARLLGFASHAHWRMADTMAKEPEKATDLMLRVWPSALGRVREEVRDMQALLDREQPSARIEPWDYLYYGEKVRSQKYAVEQRALAPHFELGRMIEAAFWMAERLYGLSFEEITGSVPVFHPDVRVWRVTDKASGAHVGVFYGDYFARPGKRSGAWAAVYRRRESLSGAVTHPVVSNNNNFAKAKPGERVLISLDDAETLFHEFGHALHALVSEVEYPSFSGTPRDFVEYPSQVHEAWVLSREVLDRFARHSETGAPMPAALVEKVRAARKFNQGYATVEYLSAAIVDMELHTRPDGDIDPDRFERETLERIGAPREVAMRHRLPHFSHLFSSDSYSAGYYSYLWSEVMDADTRRAFVEAGDDFDAATAARLRQYILAPGNTSDRAEAYRQFRGRDPDIKALLDKRGFPSGG